MFELSHDRLKSPRPEGVYNLASAFHTRPRVLVVEDDEDIGEGLGLMLSPFFDVALETSGKFGLEAASLERPDLMLVDYALPEMNGIRLMEQVRKHLGPIPAIMISAYSNRREASLAAGFDEFISKPFDTVQLTQAVARALHLY